MAQASVLPLVLGLALLPLGGTGAVAQDESDGVADAAELFDPIFLDGFEIWVREGCENWSSTSTPTGGLDNDNDGYGQIAPAIVQCAPVFPPNTDCLDSNSSIHPNAPELCNGLNDDCSVNTGDGSSEPWLGQACDGADSDACATGSLFCGSGSQQCSDDAASTIDLCNGSDDDCDPNTADGSAEPWIGQACDGGDSDLCTTGSAFCGGGSPQCSDDAASTVDLCNGNDDDCDPASPDGSEDPLLGVACDSPVDSDFCATGTNACNGVSLYCTDDAASFLEACNGDAVDEDCDGAVDEGFVLDGNPACGGFVDLGFVNGDAASTPVMSSNYTEKWLTVEVRESSDLSTHLRARFDLESPVGADFDLYIYCASCGTALASSTASGLTGHHDIVDIWNDEDFGSEDTFTAVVEVRYFNSNRCANWTLTVTGNIGTFVNQCGP